MNGIEQLIAKMRRLWVAERALAVVLLLGAGAVNLALLGVALVLIFWLHAWLVPALIAAACLLAAIVPVLIVFRARAPQADELAQMLDRRAGTRDLFSSARSFSAAGERFGPLGALTCELARERATRIALRPRWRLGAGRLWIGQGAVAGVLIIAAMIFRMSAPTTPVGDGGDVAVAPPIPTPTTTKKTAPKPEPTTTVQPMELIDDEPTPEETVKITDEMIEKYMQGAPADMDVDLTGVTPIRWVDDEVAGKDDPSKRDENEKIDPVKLDAALLKDLEQAKKTRDKTGGDSKGGVDVAVMSKDPGAKVKGKKGGKKAGTSLADATSKDPRGNPTRLAIKPERKGMQVVSAARAPSTQKGKDRPMKLLDFLAAVRRLRDRPADKAIAASLTARTSEDRPVRHEAVPDDAAASTRAYFDMLRRADP